MSQLQNGEDKVEEGIRRWEKKSCTDRTDTFITQILKVCVLVLQKLLHKSFIIYCLFYSWAYEDAPKETKIITNPTDVKEGESITLHCSTNAHPAASYKWFKGEDSLNQLSSEYKLHQAKSEDSGSYRCEASNSLGKEVSSSVIDIKCKLEKIKTNHLSISMILLFL